MVIESRWIFVPVLLQVALTLAMYLRLQQVKTAALKRGQVDEARRALHDDAWPENVLQVNNNIRNQFETPVLFYVLVFSLWSLGAVSIYAHAVAWIYAVSRIVHATVHVGANVVAKRRVVFSLGVAMLFVLTGLLVAAILGWPAQAA